MAELFAGEIILHELPFSDVPRMLKQQVADILIGLERSDLVPVRYGGTAAE